MVSESQRRDMICQLGSILKEVPNSNHIKEISEKTGIPKSTIQRYLNREDLYLELLEDSTLATETYQNVQSWLQRSKIVGNEKGGTISQARYDYSKDVLGHFNGMKRK